MRRSPYAEALLRGEVVRFRPRGESMMPRIRSGALVEVVPLAKGDIPVPGEVVLCRVGGRELLHLVKARDGDRLVISNNKGRVNGRIGPDAVYGRLSRILEG